MPLTQHEFNVAAEGIQSRIREVKLEGLRADLSAEQYRTQRKWVGVDIERTKLQTTRNQLIVAEEEMAQSRLQIDRAQVGTQLLMTDVATLRDKLGGAQQERVLNQQLIRARLQSLDLNLSGVQNENDFQRTEMRMRGYTVPGGMGAPRLGSPLFN